MRISDWVSDVCSSDLCPLMPGAVSWPGSRRNPGPDAVPGLPGRRRGIIPAILPVELQMTSFNPLDLLISPAYAQAGQAPQGGGLSFLIMPIVLIAVMYFLMIRPQRSEEHTSELQSLMRISYAVFCLKKKHTKKRIKKDTIIYKVSEN